MKLKIAKFLSVAMIALLLTGCKAQTDKSQASGASDAQQKEASSAETESAASGNINASEENTRTDESLISEDEAKDIALKKAGLKEDQISGIRIKLEYDDGKAVYEGEIVYKERKYEFEIDADSGDLLEWEDESVHD